MEYNTHECSECQTVHDAEDNGIKLEDHPTAQKLAATALEFLKEIQTLTPGKTLERKLNKEYGPGNPFFEDFCKNIRQGVKEGWIAAGKIDDEKYRRGKIMLPSADNLWMSLTAVYFDSKEVYSGQYHKHPYGEINCVIPIDDGFELESLPLGTWQGAGWTSLGPGTHHYPRARGGRGVAFFFLPSGRISYDAKPGEPQPDSLL